VSTTLVVAASKAVYFPSCNNSHPDKESAELAWPRHWTEAALGAVPNGRPLRLRRMYRRPNVPKGGPESSGS
jgi:hypothetical protein